MKHVDLTLVLILEGLCFFLTVPLQITEAYSDGDVRLVGGSNEYEGRVEVYLNEEWGTVCDDSWGDSDASVVCAQLRFSRFGSIAHSSAAFGEGTGPILLDNVRCSGSESRLADCPNPGVGVHNCRHSDDAGVTCHPYGTEHCLDGDVRLVGGSNEHEGRVEVCFDREWGTVCDGLWGNTDASVVCTQLRFSRFGSVAHSSAAFGEGSGPILFDSMRCSGSESRLVDCPNRGLGTHNCKHSEDAGVTCHPYGAENCLDGDVRLVGGSNKYEGRVEVCFDREWGTVCDGLWGNTDASVVCTQLRFSRFGSVAHSSAAFGEGSGPILFDSMRCSGSESRLVDCPNRGLGTHNCKHSEDAGVTCHPYGTENCLDGDVRLVGGSNKYEGRVEVCFDREWGTVCDGLWGNTDASVVCTQLRFSRFGSIAHSSAAFGEGSGPILFDSMRCSGSESRLVDCPNRGLGTHNCKHSEDAGVTCHPYGTENCLDGDVRLVGGSNKHEGRVEVCFDREWGTVCNDMWDNTDASVVCAQLGFSSSGSIAHSSAAFGEGTGPILLDNVQCSGSESMLADCPNRGVGVHNCIHSGDAGVTCTSATA